MTEQNEMPEQKLNPCPFCGAGEYRTEIKYLNSGVTMQARPNPVVSATLKHWCQREEGQPQNIIQMVGRDEESAISLWNTRAALTAPQPQWLPIESAPRDGTQVLVWSDELYIKPYIAWWGVDQNAPEDGNEQEEWLTGDGDSWSTGYYYTPCNPTHWMPLPAPPQTEKENG